MAKSSFGPIWLWLALDADKHWRIIRDQDVYLGSFHEDTAESLNKRAARQAKGRPIKLLKFSVAKVVKSIEPALNAAE